MDKPRVQQQVARLKASSTIASAESLCRLLQYLVDHSLERPGEPIKEHEIATVVFGRPADFDPRLDAIVRVQTGRLRSRLAEYYAGPGADDPIVVEIPKGSYAVSIHPRSTARRPVTDAAPARAGSWQGNALLALGFLAVIAASVSGWMMAQRGQASAASPDVDPPVSQFWAPLLERSGQPIVVFSNAEFVGRPESGIRYYDAKRDSRDSILDHYTGVGEVMAAHELTKLFAKFGREIRLKRGRLLTLDDAKSGDLIFVGSPAENLSLRELPITREFVFRQSDNQVRIVNLRPLPGEPASFLASGALPIREDYSLVSLSPGLEGKSWIMVLAGTTTLGTQAAVEYVCRPRHLEALLARVPPRARTHFEAVLKVRISGGVPVEMQIAAIRAL